MGSFEGTEFSQSFLFSGSNNRIIKINLVN